MIHLLSRRATTSGMPLPGISEELPSTSLSSPGRCKARTALCLALHGVGTASRSADVRRYCPGVRGKSGEARPSKHITPGSCRAGHGLAAAAAARGGAAVSAGVADAGKWIKHVKVARALPGGALIASAAHTRR